MVGKLVDVEQVLFAYATAVDDLDNHECDASTLGAGICLVLSVMGYGEVDAHAAANQTCDELDGYFSQAYYKNQDCRHKMAVLAAAIKTAVKKIEGGFDEDYRQAVAEAIEKTRDDSGPAISD